MSYTKRPRPSALSGIVSTVTDIVVTAAQVAQDPYFPEIVCRVGQIAAASNNRPPGVCSTTPSVQSGLGLARVMPPLRAYAYAEAHPWVYPLGIAAVVGIPFLLGYLVAKE
jgi:hypothetical protein